MLYARPMLDRKKESQFLPQLPCEFNASVMLVVNIRFAHVPMVRSFFLEKKRNYYIYTQRSTHRNASRKSRPCIWNYMTRVSRNAVTRDKSTVTMIRASSSTAVASKLVLRYEINLDTPQARRDLRVSLALFSLSAAKDTKVTALALRLQIPATLRLFHVSLFNVLISV